MAKENEALKEELMSIRNDHKKHIDLINTKKTDEFQSLIEELNQEHDVRTLLEITKILKTVFYRI